ncbi:hypothetical protein NQ317_009197 [Molorchus minor]|uniref:Uncharacterized protein n=1 Tax=Molorchus minor TaxID=1323400 RepID=A0ABQ9ISX7_9CUCU|nr:hypothetical protein NQ317_009197 [Molorchus minor]
MKRGAGNHARYEASRIFLLHASNTGKLNLGLSETCGEPPGYWSYLVGPLRSCGVQDRSKVQRGIGWPDGGSIKL